MKSDLIVFYETSQIERAGIKVIRQSPIRIPEQDQGNTINHIHPRVRAAYTKKAYDLWRTRCAEEMGRQRRQGALPGRGFRPRDRHCLSMAQKPAIWSFASPGGFVIRCPLANDCFACSSVAQR